jgi:hypothetical protein
MIARQTWPSVAAACLNMLPATTLLPEQLLSQDAATCEYRGFH